jgi:iron(III) transport system substrate-binding protein
MTRAAGFFLACLLGAVPAGATELFIYTALETDQLKAYAEIFRKSHPEIELTFVRDSTGVITSKVVGGNAANADLVFGVAASSMEIFKEKGLLQPYAPAGFDNLAPALSDESRPPYWVGQDLTVAVVCYNREQGRKKNVPRPESWKDLAKPVYMGQVSMPSPVSSGTGLFDVQSWIQLFGEDEGWKFMDGLHQNITHYTHSGSKPCNEAGAGEVVVGLSFDYRGHEVKTRGAPIDLVFPKEGLGWHVEASAILKGSKNIEAARTFMDWVASREANEAYAKNYAVVAHRDVRPSIAYLPDDLGKRAVEMDLALAERNRLRILAEWRKRYAAKMEKE